MDDNDNKSICKTNTCPILKYKNLIIKFTAALFGIAGGYLYYSQVGCTNGGCAITSNPYMSMLWGGLMGYLLSDFFISKKKEQIENNNNQEKI